MKRSDLKYELLSRISEDELLELYELMAQDPKAVDSYADALARKYNLWNLIDQH